MLPSGPRGAARLQLDLGERHGHFRADDHRVVHTTKVATPRTARHVSFPPRSRRKDWMATAEKSYDIADIALADKGRRRIEWADGDARAALDPRALRARAPLEGRAWAAAFTSRPRRRTCPHARGRRRGGGAVRRATRSPRRTTWPPRSWTATASDAMRQRRGHDSYYRHIARGSTPPADHDGRRRRPRRRARRRRTSSRASSAGPRRPRRRDPVRALDARASSRSRHRGQRRGPSTSSTTATAPASPPSTGSCAPPTCSSPAKVVVVGYGWCGRGRRRAAAGAAPR